MSKIELKFAQLKSAGLDLGADLHPGAPDQDAGFGGVYRQFQHGNIYYHPVMGDQAHEVHGVFLTLYLARGGPGRNPATGRRGLGFPLSDERGGGLLGTPNSLFESGTIFWTPGTDGCVVSGGVFFRFHLGLGFDDLGLPLTSNLPVAGGQAVFFERGMLWATDAVAGGFLRGNLYPPLLGNPRPFDPTPPPPPGNLPRALAPGGPVAGPAGASLHDLILFQAVPRATYDALLRWRPTLFADLWAGRLSLVNSGVRTTRVPLVPAVENVSAVDPGAPVYVRCRLELTPAGLPVPDRTLFDLELTVPAPHGFYALSPHCLYTRTRWQDFGLLHITDLHLSRRNQEWRQDFQAYGLPDAAAGYANCQDQFRDFIRYANHLHDRGLADGVVATGDLVDFVIETGDNPLPGNFARLRRMILGQPFMAGAPAGEELRLPIFTTFGNHDHRLNPYDLIFKLDIILPLDFIGLSTTMDNYSTFDLTEAEANQLQGRTISHFGREGHPGYGANDLEAPKRFLQVGFENQFAYFTRYFGPRTFQVPLGPHRLVVIDTGGDAGVPDSVSGINLAKLAAEVVASQLPHDTVELLTGAPNGAGYGSGDLDLLRQALHEAGPEGLVLVGVHHPPLAPTKGYNDYLRETEHPTADPKLTGAYVEANHLNRDGWSFSGTPYFKTGDLVGSFDFGIASTAPLQFLQLCAGVGAPRPVDLLLCGHHHDRVEYRVRWDAAKGQLQYFTDFYTEAPGTFYQTHEFEWVVPRAGDPQPTLKFRMNSQHVAVDPAAPVNGRRGVGVAQRNGHDVQFDQLTVPPYAHPLNASADPAGWWRDHRPLLLQTAALGPIDPRQRYTDDTVPEPTFQGFRLVLVRDNIIKRVRYVTIRELRAAAFVLPWETGDALVPTGPAVPVRPDGLPKVLPLVA